MGLRALGGHALTLAIAAPLVSGVLLVIYAWLLAQTLGRTIEGGESLWAVLGLVATMAAIIIARAVLAMIGEQAGTMGAEAIKKSLRDRLFSHLLAQRHALRLKPASGAVAAALIDQVDGLENFFARYLPAMIAAAILPVAFAVVLFPIDWVVALLFLFTAPLIPVFMALAGWGAQAATDRQANALSHLSAHFADRLRGLFDALDRKRGLLAVFDQCLSGRGVQLFIGEESGYRVLDECSVVTAPYTLEGQVAGIIGVIGPTRMAYGRIIPLVRDTARILSEGLKAS